MYITEGGQKRKAAKFVCGNCGKIFVRRKYKNRASRFCSHECASIDRRVKRIEISCATCGKTLKRRPAIVAKSKSGFQFCSMECKAKAQSLGGIAEMLPAHYGVGKHNTSYRRVAFEAYLHICADCGYDEFDPLVVHHLDRDRQNADVGNLVILCRNCHYKRHLLKPTSATG